MHTSAVPLAGSAAPRPSIPLPPSRSVPLPMVAWATHESLLKHAQLRYVFVQTGTEFVAAYVLVETSNQKQHAVQLQLP